MSNRCKACGMPLPPVAIQHRDEFCSTECARQHYGSGTGRTTTGRSYGTAARGRIVSLTAVKAKRADR